MKKRYLCSALTMSALTLIATVDIFAQGRRGSGPDRREQGSLKVGQKAPDFKLTLIDGKKSVKLSSFKGKKPVVLVFGSYT